jgi:hypothetical protein
LVQQTIFNRSQVQGSTFRVKDKEGIKGKMIGVFYRKPCSGVKSGYGRFLDLTKKFINNVHATEFNEDITSVLLRPLT